ncbi:MAG: hypothetical protein BMS9Abin34_052 [Patescibacteria group bacterium]|nr:MAG: hypothetical protein BMS9Abin34_052 [Patescibacteria group bacterium]
MVKVHLDTDLGGDPDDLCALALLLRWPDVEITGVTTVSDENGRRAGYTKYALQIAGKDNISVKSGADVSDGYYRHKPKYPVEEKFWPEAIQPFPSPLDEALKLLKQSIEQDAIVITIGPYTNLALLDQKYPGILQRANIYLMGGYIYPVREGFPRWRNVVDYNTQVDVNSAKHVLENSSPTLIPVSVTVETALRRAYLPGLRKSGKLGDLMAFQAEAENNSAHNDEKFGKTCKGLPEDILNFQHDSLACAAALGWDGVKFEEIPLKFELKDGWLNEVVAAQGKKTKVVTKVDGDRFNEFWFETVTARLD